VPFEERKLSGRTDFDILAITATQYVCVVQSLMEAGTAGVDWNFTVDKQRNRR